MPVATSEAGTVSLVLPCFFCFFSSSTSSCFSSDLNCDLHQALSRKATQDEADRDDWGAHLAINLLLASALECGNHETPFGNGCRAVFFFCLAVFRNSAHRSAVAAAWSAVAAMAQSFLLPPFGRAKPPPQRLCFLVELRLDEIIQRFVTCG